MILAKDHPEDNIQLLYLCSMRLRGALGDVVSSLHHPTPRSDHPEGFHVVKLSRRTPGTATSDPSLHQLPNNSEHPVVSAEALSEGGCLEGQKPLNQAFTTL